MSDAQSEAARVLGLRIRDARLACALSQEETAHLASMNVSNYGKIERGTGNPSLHTIVRIAAVLGVDPGTLVGGITGEQLPEKPPVFTAIEYVRERQRRSQR
ncbi:helix-turn-helix domain-containing protein [Planctomonas psychrotolerans]|uniref:helix-turn-helix domain-containing protein n=1 Tax=Planctomonas psychrotolerans TaxID=2528712 RepID=UPI00123BB3F2|nr:helix-turn-helix transcriptional regulator [Planctomonas psychrotolerans]